MGSYFHRHFHANRGNGYVFGNPLVAHGYFRPNSSRRRAGRSRSDLPLIMPTFVTGVAILLFRDFLEDFAAASVDTWDFGSARAGAADFAAESEWLTLLG